MGTNDKIMQGSKLVAKKFQRSSEVFPLIDSNLGYWYIILKLHKQGTEFEKYLLHTLPLGCGFHVKSVFFFLKKYSGDLFIDVLIKGLFQISVFMGQTHGEGATFRIGWVFARTQAPGDLGVK